MENVNQTAPQTNQTVFAEWTTLAYRQTEKSKGWYGFMGLIVLLFIVYDLMTGGWVVSITFLILAGVYYLSESKPSPVVKVTISDHGIRFGAQYFPYDQLKSFWMVNSPEIRILHLTAYKGVNRQISIMVPEEIDLIKLREYLLLELVEEQGKKESFSDQLIRNLGL